MSIRRRVKVYGEVQGVFFRDSTRREAERTNVTGWVQNCMDGSVEAVVEGEDYAVERMVGWLSEGPRRARIDHVVVEEEEPEGLHGFDVR